MGDNGYVSECSFLPAFTTGVLLYQDHDTPQVVHLVFAFRAIEVLVLPYLGLVIILSCIGLVFVLSYLGLGVHFDCSLIFRFGIF